MKRALKRLALWTGAAVAGAGGLWLVTRSSLVPKRPDQGVRGWPGGLAKRDEMIALGRSDNQHVNAKTGRYDYEDAKQLWRMAHNAFEQRRKLLPAGAHGTADKYSKEKYLLPAGMNYPWPACGSVDEFGRCPEGKPANFGTTLVRIGQQVAPMIPGVGTAAAAGLAYAIAIGEGKSQKDAMLSAARAAVPVQYQIAFDLGVGIASGEPVDSAAKNALLAQNPQVKFYYETGRAAYSSQYSPVKVFP